MNDSDLKRAFDRLDETMPATTVPLDCLRARNRRSDRVRAVIVVSGAVALVAAIAVAGTFGHSLVVGPATPAGPGGHDGTVAVNIGIVHVGGRPPGVNPQLVAGTVQLAHDGKVVGTVNVAGGTRAVFHVPPGAYEATAVSGSVCEKKEIVVAKGPPQYVTVTCHIR